MDWTEIVSTVLKKDADKVMLAPLSNIAGADIKFDKGYGTNTDACCAEKTVLPIRLTVTRFSACIETLRLICN